MCQSLDREGQRPGPVLGTLRAPAERIVRREKRGCCPNLEAEGPELNATLPCHLGKPWLASCCHVTQCWAREPEHQETEGKQCLLCSVHQRSNTPRGPLSSPTVRGLLKWGYTALVQAAVSSCRGCNDCPPPHGFPWPHWCQLSALTANSQLVQNAKFTGHCCKKGP